VDGGATPSVRRCHSTISCMVLWFRSATTLSALMVPLHYQIDGATIKPILPRHYPTDCGPMPQHYQLDGAMVPLHHQTKLVKVVCIGLKWIEVD